VTPPSFESFGTARPPDEPFAIENTPPDKSRNGTRNVKLIKQSSVTPFTPALGDAPR